MFSVVVHQADMFHSGFIENKTPCDFSSWGRSRYYKGHDLPPPSALHL